jgi:hypothetical protein
MADFLVSGSDSIGTSGLNNLNHKNQVWISAKIGYRFYHTSSGIYYTTTVDGGKTWSVSAIVSDVSSRISGSPDVWYDRWTYNDTGTLIYIVWNYTDGKHLGATMYTRFRTLDTSDDSLSTIVTVASIANSQDLKDAILSVCKSIGGNLYVMRSGNFVGDKTRRVIFKSDDDGATWTQRDYYLASVGVSVPILMPGLETDNNDMYLIDSDGGFGIKSYDDSANDWSSVTSLSGGTYYDVVSKTSDGTVFIISTDSTTIYCYEVGALMSVTTRTSIAGSGTIQAVTAGIDSDGVLWVAYVDLVDGDYILKVRKSTDSGVTWSSYVGFGYDTTNEKTNMSMDVHATHVFPMFIMSSKVYGSTWTAIYPIDTITRVTNIIHRYNRSGNIYTMELNLGDVISDFGLPEWLSKPQPIAQSKSEQPATIKDVEKKLAEPPVYEPSPISPVEVRPLPYEPSPFSPIQHEAPQYEPSPGLITTRPIPTPPLQSEQKSTRETVQQFITGVTNVIRNITPWREEQGETVSTWIRGLFGGKR